MQFYYSFDIREMVKAGMPENIALMMQMETAARDMAKKVVEKYPAEFYPELGYMKQIMVFDRKDWIEFRRNLFILLAETNDVLTAAKINQALHSLVNK